MLSSPPANDTALMHLESSYVPEESEMPSLNLKGSHSIENITVKEDATVDGYFFASNCTFNTLNATGLLILEQSNIQQLNATGSAILGEVEVNSKSSIRGPLVAINSIFKDTITVTASEMEFENTSTCNIVIKDDHTEKGQTVHLKGSTVIHGNIVFESENGQVFFDDHARLNGKVKGGVVALP